MPKVSLKSSKKHQNSDKGHGASDFHLAVAAHTLRRGGVVAHATEAVFGLAASAFDEAACARVAALKRRPADKRFIVIAADVADLEALVTLDVPLRDALLEGWPGPNTWILPAQHGAPPWLRDVRNRIAVRVTAHPQAAALCRAVGPLISTSANPAGCRPARTPFEVRAVFRRAAPTGEAVDFCLPGRTGPRSRPSTIRDGCSGELIRA